VTALLVLLWPCSQSIQETNENLETFIAFEAIESHLLPYYPQNQPSELLQHSAFVNELVPNGFTSENESQIFLAIIY